MKKLLAILFLLPALALATDLPDQLCGTGTTAICPVGLTYQTAYGRVIVTVDGVQYKSAYYQIPAGSTQFNDIVTYADDGSGVTVTASFRTWITKSGRTQLVHWELLGGTIE